MSRFEHRDRTSLNRRFILLLTWSCLLTLTACRQSGQNLHSGPAESTVVTSLVPPFTTREPVTYQAIRILTFTDMQSGERTSKTIVARDGEKRREEFVSGEGKTVVYLDIPSGSFILLPSSQIFADVQQASAETTTQSLAAELSELSPDLLLNQEYAGSTYQKLGRETIDGRITTRYRVTSGPETGAKTETLLWIDEAVGMPVRSETTSSTGRYSSTIKMELKDIKLTVEEGLFALPVNYQKVSIWVVLEKIKASAKQ